MNPKGRPRWKERVRKACLSCGTEFEVFPSQAGAKFCSLSCSTAYRNKQASIPCPFSPDRLYELYWREQLSVPAIVEKAKELEPRATLFIVHRWLREAGISRRSSKEASKVTFETHRKEHWPEFTAKSLEVRRQKGIKPAIDIRTVGAKGRRVWAKMRKDQYEVRVCSLPWCNNEIRRPASRFTHPERAYCCKACQNKDRTRVKLLKIEAERERRLQASLLGEGEQLCKS
jgi:hypothetical protein